MAMEELALCGRAKPLMTRASLDVPSVVPSLPICRRRPSLTSISLHDMRDTTSLIVVKPSAGGLSNSDAASRAMPLPDRNSGRPMSPPAKLRSASALKGKVASSWPESGGRLAAAESAPNETALLSIPHASMSTTASNAEDIEALRLKAVRRLREQREQRDRIKAKEARQIIEAREMRAQHEQRLREGREAAAQYRAEVRKRSKDAHPAEESAHSITTLMNA